LVALSAPNPGAQRAESLCAIHLQIQKFHHQCISGLGAIDEKRPGQRIVALDQRQRIARFLDGVAEAVQRIRFENVAGFQVRDRRRRGIHVLHIIDGRVIAHRL
jgi:hypothetical protein